MHSSLVRKDPKTGRRKTRKKSSNMQNPKMSRSMPTLVIHSSTRSLHSTGKWGFRDGTHRHTEDSQTLRLGPIQWKSSSDGVYMLTWEHCSLSRERSISAWFSIRTPNLISGGSECDNGRNGAIRLHRVANYWGQQKTLHSMGNWFFLCHIFNPNPYNQI